MCPFQILESIEESSYYAKARMLLLKVGTFLQKRQMLCVACKFSYQSRAKAIHKDGAGRSFGKVILQY